MLCFFLQVVEATTVVFENPLDEARELVWFPTRGGFPRHIGTVPPRAMFEVETFVGHEIGWRKTDGFFEDRLVVSADAHVRIGHVDEEPPLLLSAFDEEVEKLDKGEPLSGRRAYYYIGLHVEDWLASSFQEWACDSYDKLPFVTGNFAARQTTFGNSKPKVSGFAFEWTEALVFVYEGQGSTVVYEDTNFQGFAPLAAFDFAEWIATRVEGGRFLYSGCGLDAVWLAKRRKGITCVDDDKSQRHRAKANAKGLRLDVTTRPRGKYDFLALALEDVAGPTTQLTVYDDQQDPAPQQVPFLPTDLDAANDALANAHAFLLQLLRRRTLRPHARIFLRGQAALDLTNHYFRRDFHCVSSHLVQAIPVAECHLRSDDDAYILDQPDDAPNATSNRRCGSHRRC